MKARHLILTLTALSTLVPCGLLAQAWTEVTDPYGSVSFSVPKSWSEQDLGNPDAVLQLGSPDQNSFLILIVEPKEDFSDAFGYNYTKFFFTTLTIGIEALSFPEVLQIEDVTLHGADSEASIVQVSGALDTYNTMQLRLHAETPNYFVQLLMVTARSQWDETELVFHRIIDSVRVLD